MLYQEDFKRKAQEICKNVLGFAPALKNITLLEAGNNEFDAIDWIIFKVGDKAEYKICLADSFCYVYNLYKFVDDGTVLLGSYH